MFAAKQLLVAIDLVKNILFCHLIFNRKKHKQNKTQKDWIQVWNNMRMSKWWQKFGVNYPFDRIFYFIFILKWNRQWIKYIQHTVSHWKIYL